MGRAVFNPSHWLFLCVLLLSMGLYSCGGTAALDPAATDTTTDNTAQAAAESLSSSASLPAIPLDSADEGRAASAIDNGSGQVVVLGKDFLLQHNGSVDGDSLVLSAPGGEEGSGMNLAFAMYKASAGAGQRPKSLNVQALPAGLSQNYWVAVADYTSLQWKFFGPVSIPEFQLDLTGHNHRFVSAAGNVYFLLLCHAPNGCTHTQTVMVTGPAGDGELPGCPFRLEASNGAFLHRVELLWQQGDERKRFEVFRRDARPPAGDNAPEGGDPGSGTPPPGDPNAGDGGNGGGDNGEGGEAPPPPQWRLIAVVEDNRFTDHLVLPGKFYEYRVRAINNHGPSGFSNIDLGWADRGLFDCVIEGQVSVDGAGRGGVVVSLLGLGPEPLFAVTGPEGRYRFANLPPLHYVVCAQNPELEFEPAFAFADLHISETRLINFNGTAASHFGHVWGFTYTWDPIRDDGTGGLRALGNIHVGLWPAGVEPGTPELLGTQSNEMGLYQFFGLQPGDYTSKAGAEGMIFMPDIHRIRLDGQHVAPRMDFFGLPGQLPPPPPPADGGGGEDPGGGEGTL
ncbi:carboxypeptidase regulatory-like domain-containing protein [bacterium]|nr:carboxypeptidase regulatory-like domain-containing protein [bacterium]